jgi:aspartyl-tRNA(Asn)/glutamyl-tRNA(Gln) amidotransferase subunit A
VLSRLDRAGAIDLGTLHMAEFALSPTGYNAHYGHGLNPWRTTHICGGSSSGSGIAVAGRMVFGSLGTDTGGSVRHPAAMCGVTGIKPTLRRVSGAAVMPLSRSLDCVGPLAQSARDCARLLRVIAGADPRDGTAAAVPVPDYEARLDDSIAGCALRSRAAITMKRSIPKCAPCAMRVCACCAISAPSSSTRTCPTWRSSMR